MKQLILFCLLFCMGITRPISAQDASLKLKQVMEKKAEYHRRTEGEMDGYRVKIHFGPDKAKAREVKAKFQQRFPDIAAYEKYAQPNFVITVGDFKSKPEAYEMLKAVQAEFPNAFIVKEKIHPVKL